MNTIGKKIASLRKERNITQEELASAIGVSAQSVSKWENAVTMPDIMLLPVIADTFDISIDELYGIGRSSRTEVTYSHEDASEKVYEDLLISLQRAWIHGAHEPDLSKKISSNAAAVKKALEENNNNTIYVTDKKGVIYANSKLGIVYRPSKEESLPLLESEKAVDILKLIADDSVRKILHYLITDATTAFTVGSVVQKCRITEDQAKSALNTLLGYRFFQGTVVNTGIEELTVYEIHCRARMMLICMILSLAEHIADYKDVYFGYRGAAKWGF